MENRSDKPKRNIFIIILFSLGVVLFGMGSYLFWKNNSVNVALKQELESSGIETKAHVISLSKLEKRKLTQTSLRWQYMNDYMVEYWYGHSGKSEPDLISFNDYLEERPKPKVSKKGLGKVKIQNSISKSLYDELDLNSKLDVVYLNGEPLSTRILNKEGKVDIPALHIFMYICMFLFVSTIYMLWYYIKKGKTF